MLRLLMFCLAFRACWAGYDAASVGGSWLIDVYKRVFSPLQGPNMCNFWPTCSQFTKSAIKTQGMLPGMVIGADRLMRCNPFAWTYHDYIYTSISHDRLFDPVDNHIAWREPVLALEPLRPPSARVVSDSSPAARPSPSLAFAEHLYRRGDYTEAATEFLRVRFDATSPELAEYAGLMAGEAYLAAGNPSSALKAFTTLAGPGVQDFARYGKARALFAQGALPEARQCLDSIVRPALERTAQYLAGWTWYREFRFARGASCFALWRDDSVAARLAGLDGTDLSARSRTLSTLLSTVVPGLGQVYSDRAGDGIYSFLTVASTGLATYWFASNAETRDRTHIKTSIFGALTALFYAGSIYGANIAARDYNLLQKRRYLDRAEELLDRLTLEPDYSRLRDSLTPVRE